MAKLRGMVARVTYRNAETGFAVLQVQASSGQRTTVTGTFTEISSGNSVESIEFEFVGDWKMTKYGKQFECHSSEMMTSDVYYFLTKFTKGIGPKIAANILKAIPEDELAHTIVNEPKRLLQVKGIGRSRITKMQASWQEFEHLRRLTSYFSEKKALISNYLVIRIYKEFGDSAIEKIDQNPYMLTQIKGIGFKTADHLALEIGIAPDSKLRTKAALEYTFINEAETNGHTYLKLETLRTLLMELFENEVSLDAFEESLQELLDEHRISYNHETKLVGLQSMLNIESQVGSFLITPGSKTPVNAKVVNTLIDAAAEEEGVIFASKQRDAIFNIVSGEKCRFALSGYAGTGKTTVSRTILKLLAQVHCDESEIICCAFTGMAASRARAVTGFQAATIHSLLKIQGNEFVYNRHNKLPYRVIAVDEATMINAKLMAKLTEAVRTDTIFLLIGDPAQLPPIGPGNIFSDTLQRDLVESVTLTQIYRQSEDSVLTFFADYIRRGEVPPDAFASGWKDFQFTDIEPNNLFFIRRGGASDQEIQQARADNNLAILGGILKQAMIASAQYDNILTDFQVLTPMRKGPIGVENLNFELQKVLNPSTGTKAEFAKGGAALRLGDKVVHLINRDMPVMNVIDWEEKGHFVPAPTFQESTRVFNGSLGIVVYIDHDLEKFYVHHADDRIVEYDNVDFLESIEHAYALTVHKSQGSQYKNVVIPMTTSHFQMLNSQWLYTAITRATDNVHLIGQKYAFKRACTNTSEKNRVTYLSSTPELKQELLEARPKLSADFVQLREALRELNVKAEEYLKLAPKKSLKPEVASKKHASSLFVPALKVPEETSSKPAPLPRKSLLGSNPKKSLGSSVSKPSTKAISKRPRRL